ncbi:MAG: hypothetical protein JO256_01575 [Alphaproteobacteria bacterium]|nr:hypothetical protein [Alphaproteobacteria bacterium]
MKTPALLLLLAFGSSAMAQAPADQSSPAPKNSTQKPIIHDGPGLNSFSPPMPPSIDGRRIILVPVQPINPEKPRPTPPKKDLG